MSDTFLILNTNDTKCAFLNLVTIRVRLVKTDVYGHTAEVLNC